jgi:hypothetical protein
MKNQLLLILALFFFTGLAVSGQDIILKKTGEEIQAIIIDVSPGVIKYKKFENQDGPIFAIAREQVDKILYQNGKAETFRQEEPEEIKKPDKQRQIEVPLKPSPVLGFHMAYGGSNIYGDIENGKLLLATALGASFTMPAGKNNGIYLEADLLSIGCGLDDWNVIDYNGDLIEFTDAREDLGYLSLILLDRYFLNAKRIFFIEGGLYGSVLISATISGQARISNSHGVVDEGAFEEKVQNWYSDWDFGVAGGVGGRIPLGKTAKWHISVGARFYYGIPNIWDFIIPGMEGYRESNIYGLIFVGADLKTRSSK